MNLNRRNFLKSSSILVGAIMLQGNKAISNLVSRESDNFREIRNTLGVYNEKGGTIGWYIQDDTIIVIDTQFPDSAKNFMNELNSKTIQKINYLFNTHHHRDHTLGNYFLKNYSENIVAHENCPRLQILQNKGKETESQVVTANMTFDSKLKIKLPKENLKALHFGPAHTGGDIVTHFENANIVHLGDLVFNNVYPYIDNNGEGSVSGWIEVLDKIIKHFDNDSLFIFGHANENKSVTGDKDDVIRKRNYLEALYLYVSKLSKERKTVEEIADTNSIPGFDNIKELWDGAKKMNLKAMAEQIAK